MVRSCRSRPCCWCCFVLVGGLLRSHAEILRRLGAGARTATPAPRRADAAGGSGASARRAAPPRWPGPRRPATRSRSTSTAPAAAPTLLAFLTSGCCDLRRRSGRRSARRRLPAGVRTVVVTHGSERERPARLRKLAPAGDPGGDVLAGVGATTACPAPRTSCWSTASIRGEGVATSWPALGSLVGDAIEDQRRGRRRARRPRRASASIETLAAAGIGPDHPSLYPGRPATAR